MDALDAEPDPQTRLRNIRLIEQMFTSELKKRKSKTAFEARSRFSLDETAAISGYEPGTINNLAQRYARENGITTVPRRRRVDLSGHVDLSGAMIRPRPAKPTHPTV